MGDGTAGAMKAPDARNLLLGVGDELGADFLLGLETRINAFRRNDGLTFVLKDERGVLPVEYDYIDLVAKHALAVHDMRSRRLVTLRQVSLQQVQPDVFAGVSFGSRVRKSCASGRQTPLDIVMKSGQQFSERPGTGVVASLLVRIGLLHPSNLAPLCGLSTSSLDGPILRWVSDAATCPGLTSSIESGLL